MPRPYHIGIVGFGVGGGTSAALLARQGHRVELFERAPKVGPVGAGILLMPSGQMVLRELGWHDGVIAQGAAVEELYVTRHPRGTLLQLPFSTIEPGLRAYGLHRAVLFDTIHRDVAAAGVQLHLDTEIQSYRVARNEVFVRDQHGRDHGPFDFLIAADGARSILRQCADLIACQQRYPWGAIWHIGNNTAVVGRLHQIVKGTRHLIGLLPMGAGRCTLYYGLRHDRKEEVWKAGLAALRSEVLELAPEAAELFAGLDDMNQMMYANYQHVWLKRWHNNHVLFLGDAAHAMSPHLGQGINLALLDAWTFAHCLERALTPRHAFCAYTDVRRVHLRYYSMVTFLMSPFFQGDGWLKGWLRDLGLPLLARIPWLRRQMALTMAGLKHGFLGGRIRLPGTKP